MYQIKERLKERGHSQRWLIIELRKRGLVVQPPEMSQILNGACTYPKAMRVLEMCDKILSESETNQ